MRCRISKNKRKVAVAFKKWKAGKGEKNSGERREYREEKVIAMRKKEQREIR